jgi:hypothetical protein
MKIRILKKNIFWLGLVAKACNPSIYDIEARRRILSSRPA